MLQLTSTGFRDRFMVAVSLVAAVAMSFMFIVASSAETASNAASPAQTRTIGPSLVSKMVLPNQPQVEPTAAGVARSRADEAPDASSRIDAILGRARRYAVFHGIEVGRPIQPWKLDKSYLWGDIGIGPGVRTEFGAESTVIGDCYQQPGQAAGRGCINIQPRPGTPPHVEPTYRDITLDLTPVVQDIRAAVTYVSGLAATQTLERIADRATISSSECGTLNVIRVTREVNAGGANHGLTIQGCATDVFIFDVAGQWVSSGGRVRLTGGVPPSNILWVFKGRLQNSGNGGWAGTAIFDTANGADNAGKDLSCFDCALLVLNGKLSISASSNLRWHPFTLFDYGDAPETYGTLFNAQNGTARHKYVNNNPRLGSAWTGETNGQPTPNAGSDASDDGIRDLPLIQAFMTDPVLLTVFASNQIATNDATVACWIDFNRDGDFLDTGERAAAPLGRNTMPPIPVTLTFSGFREPVNGPSYLRCRISTNVNALTFPTSPIPPEAPAPQSTNPMFPLEKSSYLLNDGWPNGEVEDYPINIEFLGDPGVDYGDAPDTASGTGQGNYRTTRNDGGPGHLIVDDLYLGSQWPDLEFGALQNIDATADDLDNIPDDEDGIPVLPTISTQSTVVQLSVVATNNTANDARLRCWIDFNRNGTFNGSGVDAGEGSAPVTIDANSGTNTYTLTFSGFAPPTAGVSYIRCRIAHAPSDLAQPLAYSGEVEDHHVEIAP